MAQLSCTGLRYCDFVVSTEKDLFVERILQNNEISRKEDRGRKEICVEETPSRVNWKMVLKTQKIE